MQPEALGINDSRGSAYPPEAEIRPWTAAPVGRGLLLVICDCEGVVRGIAGTGSIVVQAQASGLRVGVRLALASVGHNAVGHALATGGTGRVTGKEHGLPSLRDWAGLAETVWVGGRCVGAASLWWSAEERPDAEWVRVGLDLGAALVREAAAREEAQWVRRIAACGSEGEVGFVVVNRGGTVLYASEAGCRLLGVDPLHDLSLSLPYLWKRVRQGYPGRTAELHLRSPAVPNSCMVTIQSMADDPEALLLSVRLASGRSAGGRVKSAGGEARYRFADIMTAAPTMQQALQVAQSVSGNDLPLLLLGESGTGKELVAQAIHRESQRAVGPFVAVNCAAFPRDLIVSELFGYQEGAFTGARRQGAPGRFEQADGGTLLLDEIGEMALEHQAMLLRVLEDGCVTRLGGGAPKAVSVRVIAATNRDLAEEVRAGRFRADLYYRLNIIPIHLPPLRERQGDVPLLARRFLEREARLLGKELHWQGEALRALEQHRWPGNVRELYNVVKRAAILAEGPEVGVEALPWAGDVSAPSRPAGGQRYAPETVEAVLAETNENISEAARRLGVARSTIYRMRKRNAAEV